MSETILNKVAESGLITLNLEDYFPKEEVIVFDLKEYLFMELILKEKDFRAALQQTDWEKYRNKHVAITCSADAVIPMWAHMLVAAYLEPVTASFFFGNEMDIIRQVIQKNIDAINGAEYTDKRVVIKGCGEVPVPESAYVSITGKLRPYAKSIMYGEPCSTVPIYKKKS
ncbi:MAG: hypothetical protein JWN76_3102 [Chitinophagaceae bacterium]|nr:hypothetical protein [Chitinophagaceae bacterium]